MPLHCTIFFSQLYLLLEVIYTKTFFILGVMYIRRISSNCCTYGGVWLCIQRCIFLNEICTQTDIRVFEVIRIWLCISQNGKHLGRATKQSISLNIFHTSSLFQVIFASIVKIRNITFPSSFGKPFLVFKHLSFPSVFYSTCLCMWTLFSFKICTVSFTKGSYSKHIMYVLPYPT